MDGGNRDDEGEGEWDSTPAENAAATEILRVLVRAWPESLQEYSAGGHLPLHLECYGRAPLQKVRYLVEGLPRSGPNHRRERPSFAA